TRLVQRVSSSIISQNNNPSPSPNLCVHLSLLTLFASSNKAIHDILQTSTALIKTLVKIMQLEPILGGLVSVKTMSAGLLKVLLRKKKGVRGGMCEEVQKVFTGFVE